MTVSEGISQKKVQYGLYIEAVSYNNLNLQLLCICQLVYFL